jgi:hypothetical protein
MAGVKRALVIAWIGLTPGASAAQQPGAITIDSVLRAVNAGAQAINFAGVEPRRFQALLDVTATMRANRTADLTIDDFAAAATSTGHRFLDILRWDRDRVERVAVSAGELLRLQQIVSAAGVGLGPRAFATDSAHYKLYIGAMEDLNNAALTAMQASSRTKLQRYEMKYGPASPRLNPVETIANYALERIPGSPFAPGPNGPSRLELVLNYSTSDVTAASAAKTFPLRVISGAHAGLRVYSFRDSVSRGPIAQLLHPGSIALALSSFAPGDLPLQSPLTGTRRYGGFVQWGHLRAAAAFGQNWRAAIGTGAQLIPHLF